MSPIPRAAALLLPLLLLAAVPPASAVTPNGRLQIIHLDVEQGDGAVIITPLGQVAMFDNGPGGSSNVLGKTVAQQLTALGITHIDDIFTSHYHSDHLGGIDELGAAGIAFDYAWDRGSSYSSTYYTTYVNTVGSKRRTLTKDQVITLDSLSAHPVYIKCVNLNGAGISTTDENALSAVYRVSYGEFDESFGGDIAGVNSGSYKNVESTVGPQMGAIEVYKVHHHGSATSSYTAWLTATAPKVGIISCGNGNSYGHPTAAALTRLHTAGVHTYWTETGSGATPDPSYDTVASGQIIIQATWQGAGVDTIRGSGFTSTFTNSGTGSDVTAPTVAMTSPDGGETWKAGSSHAITWTASDDVGVTGVTLAYSTDGGASFPNTIASGLANSGSYAWPVPSLVSSTVRVRAVAVDAAGNAGRDSSAANFTIDKWIITASAGAGGSLVPSGSVAVVQGASQHFSIAPTTGYRVATLTVDGGGVTADTTYTFSNVTANHTIAATFAINTYTITASAGAGGSIVPGGAVVVSHGASQHFSIAPVTGYHVAMLMVDGSGVTADTTYTFSNVTANHTIAATFATSAYTVTATAAGGGTVSLTPQQDSYSYGASVELGATADSGWAFTGWAGDTSGTENPVTLTVTGDRVVTATFADVAPPIAELLSPLGGETWEAGQAMEVRWSAADNAAVDSVNVDYSVTGPEGPWLPVAHGLANTGSTTWTLPEMAADSARVRVTAYDPGHNTATSMSPGTLRIIEAGPLAVGDGRAMLALSAPRPNPSRGTVGLRFTLPQAGHARLEVLDLAGRRVMAAEGDWPAGPTVLRWDGDARTPAGLYFVRLTTPWGTRSQRLVRLD
jgi:beta-lactamase superfamily II metal-dependent hydrolase